jgi:hypothetical protein
MFIWLYCAFFMFKNPIRGAGFMNDLQRKYGRQAIRRYKEKNPLKYNVTQVKYYVKKGIENGGSIELFESLIKELKESGLG